VLQDGCCEACTLPFERQFCVGWRRGVLKELINQYKFGSRRAAYFYLADMMFARTGRLEGVRIVPLPTIGRHIRERGFDHMEKLGRRLARLSGGKYEALLERNKNTTQVGASMEQRKQQAAEAFCLRKKIEPGSRVLLLDDV